MKKLFNIVITTLVSISLVSCARYSAQPLSELSTVSENNGVGIASKALTPEESKRYLGQNLQRSGIQPIQLYIENTSDKTYYFNPTKTDLTLIPPSQIADAMHTMTPMRTLIWTPVSLMMLAATAVGSALSGPGHANYILPLAIAVGLPAGSGLNSAIHNSNVDDDYQSKGAKEIKLEPHSTLNCVLFVKEGHNKKAFSVALEKEHSDQTLKFTTQVS